MNLLNLRQQYLDELEAAQEVVQNEGTEFFKKFGIKVEELVGRLNQRSHGLQRDPTIVFVDDPSAANFKLGAAYKLLTGRLQEDKSSKEDWRRIKCLSDLVNAAKNYLEAK